jgi:hypothetical protein
MNMTENTPSATRESKKAPMFKRKLVQQVPKQNRTSDLIDYGTLVITPLEELEFENVFTPAVGSMKLAGAINCGIPHLFETHNRIRIEISLNAGLKDS